jgi:hypothetical protein
MMTTTGLPPQRSPPGQNDARETSRCGAPGGRGEKNANAAAAADDDDADDNAADDDADNNATKRGETMVAVAAPRRVVVRRRIGGGRGSLLFFLHEIMNSEIGEARGEGKGGLLLPT